MKNWKCVMDKLVSLADLQQYFMNSVILFKEKPTKVLAISDAKVFKLLDLESQKITQSADPFGHITPPNRRVGMVNYRGNVLYMRRIPMRRYQMGLNTANTNVTIVGDCMNDQAGDARDTVRSLACRELADAMFNKYPTLKDALAHNKEFGGGMAFDKQFAVDARKRIYYRDKKVGSLPSSATTAAKIAWDAGYEYLSILLDGNHEKDLRTVAATCSKG